MSKFAGLKKGDRFRLSMEGVISQDPDGEGDVLVKFDERAGTDFLWAHQARAPTFSITKIDPPLAVGDMVTWGNGKNTFELVAIRGGRAIMWNGTYAASEPLSSIRKASA